MRYTVTLLCALAVVVGAVSCSSSTFKSSARSSEPTTLVNPNVYDVNKTVAQFPDNDDLSSPEGAYASIARIRASEKREDWAMVLPKGAALPPRQEMRMPDAVKKALLNANILEVRMTDNEAVVIAEIAEAAGKPFDIRHLVLEDARWVNAGHDHRDTMEDARRVADLTLRGRVRPTPVHRGAFGPPRDGVRVALQAARSSVEKGELLQLYAVVHNKSDKPVQLAGSPYVTINITVNVAPVADMIGNVEFSKDVIMLAPGEERVCLVETFDTSHWSGECRFSGGINLFGEHMPFVPVGELSVQVE